MGGTDSKSGSAPAGAAAVCKCHQEAQQLPFEAERVVRVRAQLVRVGPVLGAKVVIVGAAGRAVAAGLAREPERVDAAAKDIALPGAAKR